MGQRLIDILWRVAAETGKEIRFDVGRAGVLDNIEFFKYVGNKHYCTLYSTDTKSERNQPQVKSRSPC